MLSNTYTITTILAIFWLHFVSDFLMQTDKMAQGKSSSNKLLTIHVAVYSMFFLIFCGPVYAMINFVLHWVTDYNTSRVTKKLWEKKEVHWFFAVIGLDQAIHYTCLFLTVPLIGWGM